MTFLNLGYMILITISHERYIMSDTFFTPEQVATLTGSGVSVESLKNAAVVGAKRNINPDTLSYLLERAAKRRTQLERS